MAEAKTKTEDHIESIEPSDLRSNKRTVKIVWSSRLLKEGSMVNKTCTYTKTKTSFVRQLFFKCASCFSDEHLGVCFACSKTCHKDHNIRLDGIYPAFCDCGLQCCKVPCLLGSKCAFDFKISTDEQQIQYHCSTCWDETPELSCCKVCAETCHQGHELISLSTTAICVCGLSSHQTTEKQLILDVMVDKTCTYTKTKTSFVRHPFFECASCFSDEDSCVCFYCSKTCHKGHNIRFDGIYPSYCDCGLQCCKVPCLVGSKCAFDSNSSTGEQHIQYHCSTCWGETPEFSCCKVCAETCHQGHELISLSTTEKTVCVCGRSSHQKPETQSILDDSSHWVEISVPELETYEETCYFGKWLVFKHFDELEELWKRVRIAILTDKLQGCTDAKCSTIKYNPSVGGPGPRTKGVICVYTYEHNMDAIGFKLIEIAEQDIKYKTENATEEGKYVHTGDGKITIKTIFWNNGRPSFVCEDKPCHGTSKHKKDIWRLNVVEAPLPFRPTEREIFGRWIVELENEDLTNYWYLLKENIECKTKNFGIAAMVCPPKRNPSSAEEQAVFLLYVSRKWKDSVGFYLINLVKKDIVFERKWFDRRSQQFETLYWNNCEPAYEIVKRRGITKNWRTGDDI